MIDTVDALFARLVVPASFLNLLAPCFRKITETSVIKLFTSPLDDLDVEIRV